MRIGNFFDAAWDAISGVWRPERSAFHLSRRIGTQTVALDRPPSLLEGASVAGRREGEGPLRRSFDYISQDALFRRFQLGESGERHAQAVLRPRLRQGGDRAVGAGLHTLRRPAEPVRRLGLRAPGPEPGLSGPLRSLLHDGGVAPAGLTFDRRRLRKKSCSADELAFLLCGAAVPFSAGIRQRAPADEPVDGDGRGRAHPRATPGRAPMSPL